MKCATLFSGGKDSLLALHKAVESGLEPACLISMVSANEESYMFHVPNVSWTSLQAEVLNIPLLQVETAGEKEKELDDLRQALEQAKEDLGIEAVVTGAVHSTYQACRIQRICHDLGLVLFNPLWLMDQEALLREAVGRGFTIIVVGVFAYPLDESWLGRVIDEKAIDELVHLRDKYGFNPAGEGGEIETFVLACPLFSSALKVTQAHTSFENHAGTFSIDSLEVVK